MQILGFNHKNIKNILSAYLNSIYLLLFLDQQIFFHYIT